MKIFNHLNPKKTGGAFQQGPPPSTFCAITLQRAKLIALDTNYDFVSMSNFPHMFDSLQICDARGYSSEVT